MNQISFVARANIDLDQIADSKSVDTPNIVLIKVTANRITYWDGEDEGEIQM